MAATFIFFSVPIRLMSQSIWCHEAKNLYNLKNKLNYLYAKHNFLYNFKANYFFVLNETWVLL